jgi:hypothetical protein
MLDDPISRWLIKHEIPVTRENWIAVNYLPDDPPEPWTSEHEQELPRRSNQTPNPVRQIVPPSRRASLWGPIAFQRRSAHACA